MADGRLQRADWGIQSEIVRFDDQLAVVRATVTNAAGLVMAQGHKQEEPRHFGDYLEKAETGAVGRALGYLGYGTQFAPEFEEGERIVDSPVERPKASTAPGARTRAAAPAASAGGTPPAMKPEEALYAALKPAPSPLGGEQFRCAGCGGEYTHVQLTNDDVLPARDWFGMLVEKGITSPACRTCAVKLLPASKKQPVEAGG